MSTTAIAIFERNRDMIQNMIPPGLGLTADRFKQVMVYCTRTTPKLLECQPESLVAAVAQVAQLGLDLAPALGHAYLVPYKSNCQLQIGYKGYIALALRGGEVKNITAHAVYERDEFAYEYGTNETVTHRPALKDRGELVAAWAVATLSDGARVFRVIGADDIAKAESFGQGRRDDSPWKQHRDEMARKTAIRRLVRDLVLCSAVQRAMAADDMVVNGMDGDYIEGEWVGSKTEELPTVEPPRTLKSRVATVTKSTDADALRAQMVSILTTMGAAPSQFREWLAAQPEFEGKVVPPVADWDAGRLGWAVKALGNGIGQRFVADLIAEDAETPADDDIPV